MTAASELSKNPAPGVAGRNGSSRIARIGRGDASMGSVIKKRRKKMRKHKQRKLLKRQRHKK